jgi:hypothetical protein
VAGVKAGNVAQVGIMLETILEWLLVQMYHFFMVMKIIRFMLTYSSLRAFVTFNFIHLYFCEDKDNLFIEAGFIKYY